MMTRLQGLADLHARVLRTPIEPRRTLLDDPLRVLRAVRFASRLGFALAPELRAAACAPEVVAALGDGRVSRERIGVELDAMLAGRAPLAALRTLHALGLAEAVFRTPHGFTLAPSQAPAAGAAAAAAATAAQPPLPRGVLVYDAPAAAPLAARYCEVANSEQLAALSGAWLHAGRLIAEGVGAVLTAVPDPADFCCGSGAAVADDRAVAEALGVARGTSLIAQPEVAPDPLSAPALRLSRDEVRRLLYAATLYPLVDAGELVRGKKRLRAPDAWVAFEIMVGPSDDGAQAAMAAAAAAAAATAGGTGPASAQSTVPQLCGIKRARNAAQDVTTLQQAATLFIQTASLTATGTVHDDLVVALGMQLREVKGMWPQAVVLAMAVQAVPILGDAHALPARMTELIARFQALTSLIRARGLDGCWLRSLLLNGTQVSALLGIHGPAMRPAMEEQLRWQLLHPRGTEAQAEQHLRAWRAAADAPVVK
jgi:hypothetical protein